MQVWSNIGYTVSKNADCFYFLIFTFNKKNEW